MPFLMLRMHTASGIVRCKTTAECSLLFTFFFHKSKSGLHFHFFLVKAKVAFISLSVGETRY